MNKKLQYVIAFSCLLVAGSIAYYFVSYIPEKNLQSLEKDCYKMATDRKIKTVKKSQALTTVLLVMIHSMLLIEKINDAYINI